VGAYQMDISAIRDNFDQVSKTMSMQVEIKKGLYFGEVQVKLGSQAPY
jgi:hypothetical protein